MEEDYLNSRSCDCVLKSDNSESYTRGACCKVFQSICTLHLHLASHGYGGSYYYSHQTRTAFPRFESPQTASEPQPNKININSTGTRTVLQRFKSISEASRTDIADDFDTGIRSGDKNSGAYEPIEINIKDDPDNYSENRENELSFVTPVTEPFIVKVERTNGDDNISIDQLDTDSDINDDSTYNNSGNVSIASDTDRLITPTAEFSKEKQKCSPTAWKTMATEACINDQQNDGDNTILSTSEKVLDWIHPDDSEGDSSDTTSERALDDVIPDVNKCDVENDTETLKMKSHFTCRYCGETYDTWKYFRSHLRRRHETKDGCQCDKCGKFFHTKTYLYTEHIKSCGVPSDERQKLKCDLCGKLFSTKKILKSHKSHVHENQKSICDICGQSYKDLRRHILRHNKDRVRVQCDICSKTFCDRFSLGKHKNIHKSVGKHQCTFCGKLFHQRYNMNAHMRQHTAEKPYKCDICSLAFTHNVSRKAHMAVHERDSAT